MDDQRCPNCDATTVLPGRLPRAHRIPLCFEPTGMPWFRWSGRSPRCSEDVRACLACGLVWTHLDPAEFRAFIDKHGTDGMRLNLAPFQKTPSDRELT